MPITRTYEKKSSRKKEKKTLTKEERREFAEQKKEKIATMKREFVEKIIAVAKEKHHFPWEAPNFCNFPKSLDKLEKTEKFNEENSEHPQDINGSIYLGANLIRLSMIAEERGYSDSRWGTYEKIKSMKGHVKKGEKGTTIWYYKPDGPVRQGIDPITGKWGPLYKRDKDGEFLHDEQGEKIPERNPIFGTLVVFNVCQTEGLDLKPEPKLSELDAKDRCEKMENIIAHSEAPVKHDQYSGSGRYYSPLLDEVHVPPVEMFKSMSAYYATVAHEIGHSTGHEKRCNRDLSGSFGSNSYAREELVAELTAVFLSCKLGVKIPPKELDNHAEYIRSWDQNIKTLTEKPEEFYKIIADADKATKYIETHMLKKEHKQEHAATIEAEKNRPKTLTENIANDVKSIATPKPVLKKHRTTGQRKGIAR